MAHNLLGISKFLDCIGLHAHLLGMGGIRDQPVLQACEVPMLNIRHLLVWIRVSVRAVYELVRNRSPGFRTSDLRARTESDRVSCSSYR